MITEIQIKLFNKYGDIDCWARNSSTKEKLIMTDNDWYQIDSFLQDLILVEKGLTSIEFNNSLNNKLRENCDSDFTIDKLKEIVKKLQPNNSKLSFFERIKKSIFPS